MATISVDNNDLGVYKHSDRMDKKRFTSFKKWIIEKYYKKYSKGVYCKILDETVTITKSGLQHSLNLRGSVLKTKSITALGKLIKTALLYRIESDKRDEGLQVILLRNTITIDGEIYLAKMFVKQGANGRYYYHHDIASFKKA